MLHIEILVGQSNGTSTDSSMLVTEYGRTGILSSIQDVLSRMYTNVNLNYCTLDNYHEVLDNIEYKNQYNKYVIFQLCDGVENDGYPGISVVREIEKRGIPHTGANSYFYSITTSKPLMKHEFTKHGVSTAPYTEIYNIESLDIAEREVQYPMIIKPNVSYASIGITTDSLVSDRAMALSYLRQILSGINGEGITEYFAEQFLPNREYTVLVCGSIKTGIVVYEPVERSFDRRLPVEQRLLFFDKYWDGYDVRDARSIPEHAAFYEYVRVYDTNLSEKLKQLAKDAYASLCGNSYGRVDIRSTHEVDSDGVECLYVLEVNAQPSLSFDTETSIGQILHLNNTDIESFIKGIIDISTDKTIKL